MKQPAAKPTKRIAVLLGLSGQSTAIMNMALVLAADLRADIEGVFVEDADLLRSSGLPFLREVRSTTLNESQLSGARLQRELRGLARQARRSLESCADRQGVNCSFRVWRGSVRAEILTAGLEAEILTMGPAASYLPGYATQAARKPAGDALPPSTAAVLFNGSDASQRALAAASKLVAGDCGKLSVLLQTDRRAGLPALYDRVLKLTGRHPPLPVFFTIGPNQESLARAVAKADAQILLLGADNPLLSRDAIWRSVRTVRCPLMVVR